MGLRKKIKNVWVAVDQRKWYSTRVFSQLNKVGNNANISKNHVHEQKFKDILSSTWQVSVERIVLDLESEVMRGPDSIPTWG